MSAAVNIVDADDVAFTRIAAHLNLYHLEWNAARVGGAVHGADWEVCTRVRGFGFVLPNQGVRFDDDRGTDARVI